MHEDMIARKEIFHKVTIERRDTFTRRQFFTGINFARRNFSTIVKKVFVNVATGQAEKFSKS